MASLDRRGRQGCGCEVSDPDDIETLAAAEHESWAGWATYMLNRMEAELDAVDPTAARRLRASKGVQRWRRQAATSYADLPESEKESDRIEARKKLAAYRP